MILLDNLTIPSSFQKLDTNITAAGAYANVRDLQRLALNHNILVAQRIRRTLATWQLTAGERQHFSVTPYLSESMPPVAFSGTLLVNPYCQQLRFDFYCQRTLATPAAHPELGVFLWRVGGANTPKNEAEITTTTVTSTSFGWVTLTVPIPYDLNNDNATNTEGRIVVGFKVYVVARVDTSESVFTGATVIDSGSDFIRIANSTALVYGRSVEIDGRNAPPQMVVGPAIVFAAADKKYFLRPTMNELVTASDTVTARNICGIEIRETAIHELNISAFDNAQAGL